MSDALVIAMELRNLTQVSNGLRQAARDTKAMNAPLKETASAARAAVGPYQRLAQLSRQAAQARREGNTLAFQDLRMAAAKVRAQTEEGRAAKAAAAEAARASKQRERDAAKAAAMSAREAARMQKAAQIANQRTSFRARGGGAGGGPAAALQQAQIRLRQAIQGGDPTQIFDARYRATRAQATYKRAQQVVDPQKPSFMNQLLKVLGRSRVGFGGKGGGGGIMPLAGDLAGLLGSAGPMGSRIAAMAAGPIGIAVAAGALAMKVLWDGFKKLGDMASEAADHINELRNAGFASGGTAQEVGKLKTIGGAIGLSAEDMAQMSRQFREAITSGGYGTAYAAQAGITATPGPNGKVDTAGDLLQFADYLRKVDKEFGREEAIRKAHAEGLDKLLPLLDLSNNTIKELKKDAELQANLQSPEDARNAAEYTAEMSRMNQAFATLRSTLGRIVLPVFTKVAQVIADCVNAISSAIEAIKKLNPFHTDDPREMAKKARERLEAGDYKSPEEKAALEFGLKFADSKQYDEWRLQEMSGKKRKSSTPDKQQSALDRNTEAVNANTQATKDGTFGGGDRARNARPQGWAGWSGDNWSGEAYKLGAFTG